MSIPPPNPVISPVKSVARNQTIEGLRGFSAGLVLLFHVYEMGAKAGMVPVPTTQPGRDIVDKIGPFGVMIFFMISGFVITQSLVKHGNVGVFLKNRALRIFPVFGLLHLIMFTAGPIAGYEWMGEIRHDPRLYVERFTANALFVPGVWNYPIAQKNAWSLSFEAVFYVLACLALLTCRPWMNRAKNPNFKVAVGTAWVSGALFLAGAGWFLATKWFAWFFVLGAVTYTAHQKTQKPFSRPGRAKGWEEGGAAAENVVGLSLSLEGTVVGTGIPPHLGPLPQFPEKLGERKPESLISPPISGETEGEEAGKQWLKPGYVKILGLASVPLLAAFFAGYVYAAPVALLCGFLFFCSMVWEQGAMSRLLRMPPFQFLGRISYSLYLIHPFLLDPARSLVTKLHGKLPGPVGFVAFAVLGIALAVYVASLSYQWIELRFTKWLSARLSPPAATA